MPSTSHLILISIIFFQWMLLTFLLSHEQESKAAEKLVRNPSLLLHQLAEHPLSSLETATEVIAGYAASNDTGEIEIQAQAASSAAPKWTGVAATLALRSPKWFHRRYTAMIHNILANTPETFVVQIFINSPWWKEEIHKFHRGMILLEKHPRVNITEIPADLLRVLTKPKMIMTHRFIWENLLHDRVFFFSGNGVRCANAFASWETFDGIDFLGAPSKRYRGGDIVIHSIRNRQAMLDVIDFKGDSGDAAETYYFSTGLEELDKKMPGKYRIATYQEQVLFAGGAALIMQNNTLRDYPEQFGPSFVMSGTEPNAPWEVRDHLLMICPEWKVLFPNLHDPNCFGSKPNAEMCAASICALNPDHPKAGC
jgi:hypothetical protein